MGVCGGRVIPLLDPLALLELQLNAGIDCSSRLLAIFSSLPTNRSLASVVVKGGVNFGHMANIHLHCIRPAAGIEWDVTTGPTLSL